MATLGITTAQKEKAIVKTHLGHLARSDYHHDFGKNEANTANILNAGLPEGGGVNKDYSDEPKSFISVIGSVAGIVGNKWNPLTQQEAIDYKAEFLGACKDRTAGAAADSFTFKTGCRHGATSFEELHTYTGQKMNITGKNGKQITENLRLANCALVIDFNHIHFLETLTNGEATKGTKLYVITNPQSVNDAAPKPRYNDVNYFSKATGITIHTAVDLTPSPIVYSAYNHIEADTNNNFFSKYNFTLSPLLVKKTFLGKNPALVTNLTVKFGTNISDIKDTKIQNSKTQVLKKIQQWLNNVGKAFVVNEGVQRKRSGDWFTVLSCFTILSRQYKNGNGLNDNLALTDVTHGNIYFVTHDQIAVAFALMMGVNVIYLVSDGAYRWVYVFQNTKFVAAYNPEANMRDEIAGGKAELLGRLTEYNTRRNGTITALTRGAGDTLETLIQALSQYLDGAQQPAGLVPDELKKRCLGILKKAVIITFFTQSCPDPAHLLRILGKQLPAAANNDERKKQIREIYQAFKSAEQILNDFDGTMSEGLINKIKRFDILKRCADWQFKSLKKEDRFFTILAPRNAPEDQFVFITYLKHFPIEAIINDGSAKQEIVKVFTKLLEKLLGGNIFGQISIRTKEYANLNFKLLAEHVRIFMLEEDDASPHDVFAEMRDDQGTNALKVVKVTKENTKDATEDNRNSDNKFVADADVAAAGAEPAPVPEGNEPPDVAMEGGGIQRGGYGTTAGKEIGNPEVVDTLTQSTYTLLTGHVQSTATIYREQEFDNDIGINVGEALIGGGSQEIIAKFPPELPIYIALEGLRHTVTELKWHPDYEYYVYYYQFLESLATALAGVEEKEYIALAIRELLLTLNTTVKGKRFFEDMFQVVQEKYAHIYHVTNSISYMICGSFEDYQAEDDAFLQPYMEVFNRQSVKEYINKVISIFEQMVDGEFYTDGNRHGTTLKSCNYDLQKFSKKVSALQLKIDKRLQVSGDPLLGLRSIFAIRQETAKQKGRTRRNLTNKFRNIQTIFTQQPTSVSKYIGDQNLKSKVLKQITGGGRTRKSHAQRKKRNITRRC